MYRLVSCAVFAVLMMVLAGNSVEAQTKIPKVKFGQVEEVAPGVYFRFAPIDFHDKSVFGGCNNIWVVFKDYVLVYDSNFPKEAKDVIKAVRKTTDKPIRFVVDSHHHGDHAYGNAEFAKLGATIISSAPTAEWLRTKGPEEFALAGKGPTGRKDVAASELKQPSIIFEDKMILDDGNQRVELLFLGHAHTPGDAVAYLPKHKILCTGDACVNGAFNFMGHSDSASWIRVLERMKHMDVDVILPGHGAPAGPELIGKQQRYFIELRRHVQKGIDSKKEIADIIKTIDMPWHKKWTGVEARERVPNIQHAHAELTGQVMPWDLVEDFGIYEGPSPTKESPGWAKPKRIIVPNLSPSRLYELKLIAPEVLFVPVRSAEEAAKEAGDADAVLGYCTPEIVRNGKKLRWVQVGHAGVENDLFPEMKKSNIVLTNTQKIYGPNVADQAMALLLALTRGTAQSVPAAALNKPGAKSDAFRKWSQLRSAVQAEELHGKTMVVVGLGGIGKQISRRAHGFGMHVIGIDPNANLQRPSFVMGIDHPKNLNRWLSTADVVVLACPLTNETRGMMGAKQFKLMKPSALLINIARGAVVQTEALTTALKSKQIAGVGLDVTDPEPLPDNHAFWKMSNVVVSPHVGGFSSQAKERRWRLFRENVRRFTTGERLLCVVDKMKGY